MRFFSVPIITGTRVRSIKGVIVPDGLTGTVVECYLRDRNEHLLYVNWDKEMPEFHSCGGKAKPGHGWNVRADTIQIIGCSEWKGVESD